ncbi:tRNA epoxyqueuosine(34) reductase QueG [Novosphingobium album (ex Liu et al. 2023)]|uniref:Epoxyqueuosine reductase n=1 Tax=Novosphingobium album (ex Liu et al. 2023) TaxID=3031130 RepID=A0ABT5WV99_9SPHN|nr:tRNA epoxyqueuosine(34) reductase QueG [Novosphingobium album (ex Liu et al. 2023)]MDE8653792.1 tRNA epoxyqueuosine(34) reductase QueG [Novosphingobium album (ex Liu et al. 2023)]
MVNAPSTPSFADDLAAQARALGFCAFGVAPAREDAVRAARLDAWLEAGMHGAMGWMAERAHHRRSPQALWPEARGVIVLGMSYAPAADPLALAAHPGIARVSAYAQGADYHDVVKKALKALARWLVAEAGKRGLGPAEVKVFTDTAPVMEKPLGQAAGIGWQGKHTNLVSRRHGSWLFLGEIYTTLELGASTPEADHCGSCRACQDACPTAAFPEPYRLDARRCISYLTIEHKGPIAEEFRAALGNRIYGCDDCLAVCPWNKFAGTAHTMRAFLPRGELAAAELADLLTLDDAGFRKLFSGSPIKRIGRDRFVRNCLYAAGNSGQPALLAQVAPLRADPDPVVAEAAEWATARLTAVP